MKRLLVVLAVVVASTLALNAATAPANTFRKCIPNREVGVEIINHVTLITYCGSAKTTFKSAGKTTTWTNGMCLRIAGAMIVGFGKFTTVSHTPISTAFYLVIPAVDDGTFKVAVLKIQHKGQTLSANKVTAVVKGHRTRGTYSGKFLNGPIFAGSFTCK
jgi:hypothetical protein